MSRPTKENEIGLTMAVLRARDASPRLQSRIARPLSNHEIAELCGCSDAAISILISSALEKARKRMEAMGISREDFAQFSGMFAQPTAKGESE